AYIADRKLPPAKQEYRDLEDNLMFVLDERGHSVHLTDQGVDFLSPGDHEQFVLPDLSTAVHRLEKDHDLDAATKLTKRQELETEYASKAEKLHIVHQLLR